MSNEKKKNKLYPFFQKYTWGNYFLRGKNGRFRKTLKKLNHE